MEHKNGEPSRLVLGFDAGCMTCSEVAKRIEEHTDRKVEVRSLRDPQLEHFRRQALGENAPWAPTLLEIKGTKVRAWTGLKMGVVLGQRLGVVATWRTLQALGELSAPRAQDCRSAMARPGMSRRQFMKGLGGAAVALGVLTGTGNLASVALARSGLQTESLEALKSVKRTDLVGEELIDASRRVAQHRDIVNLMGQKWSTRVHRGKAARAFEDGEQSIQLHDEAPGRTLDRASGLARIAVKAAKHDLKNGISMLAIAYKLPRENKVLIYYEFDQPILLEGEDEFESRAILYRVEGEEAIFEGLSVDGVREVSGESSTASTRLSCGGCSGSNCASARRYCKRIRWGCLTVACGACIPACGSLAGCLYCVSVQCPFAYFVTCCRRVGYRCVGCRYCR